MTSLFRDHRFDFTVPRLVYRAFGCVLGGAVRVLGLFRQGGLISMDL
jgi:hypothetical protein